MGSTPTDARPRTLARCDGGTRSRQSVTTSPTKLRSQRTPVAAATWAALRTARSRTARSRDAPPRRPTTLHQPSPAAPAADPHRSTRRERRSPLHLRCDGGIRGVSVSRLWLVLPPWPHGRNVLALVHECGIACFERRPAIVPRLVPVGAWGGEQFADLPHHCGDLIGRSRPLREYKVPRAHSRGGGRRASTPRRPSTALPAHETPVSFFLARPKTANANAWMTSAQAIDQLRPGRSQSPCH
jgi:hypothetical protein